MSKKWFNIEEPNELKRFGYSAKSSAPSRHKALSKAIKSPRNSGLEVFHKLLGLSNATKESQPLNYQIYKADANFIKKLFYDTEYW